VQHCAIAAFVLHLIQVSIQISFFHPTWGELAAPPVKRLRQMEAFRIVMPLNFLQTYAGGAASSPHFVKSAKHLFVGGARHVCAGGRLFRRHSAGTTGALRFFNAFTIGLIKNEN
jgi:hypothetical protein